jgi:hypothetical protein
MDHVFALGDSARQAIRALAAGPEAAGLSGNSGTRAALDYDRLAAFSIVRR